MNARPIKSTYIEVPYRPTAENKANLAFVFDFVKEPEALDFVSCLIVLAAPVPMFFCPPLFCA